MSSPVSHIPARYRSITPTLNVHDVAEAIAFYQKVFGAEEVKRVSGPEGAYLCWGEVCIGDSLVALGQTYPNWNRPGPHDLGGSTVNLMLYVEDLDAVYARAVAAGVTVTQPPINQYWGDRYAEVIDPFGHKWQLATRIENLTSEEMSRGADQWLESLGPRGDEPRPIRGGAASRKSGG